MRLFLDTEWADTIGSELVSIALVSEDGNRSFYAERDPLPAAATDFVRHVVYPLLEGGQAAMSDAQITRSLRAFLSETTDPVVLADYPNDLALLSYALAGFDLPDEQAEACGSVPAPLLVLISRGGAIARLVEEYFVAHRMAAARRHNAMVDAQALRAACLAANI
jgi:hypothetical protein